MPLTTSKYQTCKAESIKNRNIELSIIIPCFNEQHIIHNTVKSVCEYMSEQFPETIYELLLVDDGSTDDTQEKLIELSITYQNIKLLSFAINKGRGAAIKYGMQHSNGAYIILLDADLSYDVYHIGEILNQFKTDPKTDVVVVSPYMQGGIVKGVPFNRMLLSRIANWALSGSFSLNLSTVTCVVRGYRGEIIRSIPLFEDGKELHLEIIRKLDIYGANIIEIPGRLIWKNQKKIVRRQNNLKVVKAAKRHILYGFLTKPTRIFKYAAVLFLLIGIYESYNIFLRFLSVYQYEDTGFWYSAWKGLYASFVYSPHTFIIAGVSFILSLQTFSYLAILQVLKLQQEETLRHLMAVLDQKKFQHQAM